VFSLLYIEHKNKKILKEGEVAVNGGVPFAICYKRKL